MDLKNYFLCSKEFVDEFSLTKISNTIDRFGDPVCIAHFDFDKINALYEEREANGEYGYPRDIWARELTGCNVDITMFNIRKAKCHGGLFEWIIDKIGASTEKDVAAVIGGICVYNNQDPIEFFNEYSKDGRSK